MADTIERLEALVGHEHVSEEYVRFRIDLLKAQWAVRHALTGASPVSQSAGRTRPHRDDTKRQPHEPALEPDAILFDRGLLQALLAALRDAAARPPRRSADLSRLATAVDSEPALLTELARKAAFGPDQAYLDSLAGRLEVSAEALLFFGRALAAPFVAAAARNIGKDVDHGGGVTGAPGHCALCGSPPAMAKLRRDDGKRILFCSLCDNSWEFTRLTCPYCGSRDREALMFLRPAETDPRWIETCDECKRYIKTVDARRLPEGEPIIPVVEEAATLHLDLLAEREGYARRLPYTACG